MSWGVVVLFLVMFGLLVGALRISLMLARRSICTVIGIFRRHNAVQIQNARTLRELGLADHPLFRLLRDYKPWVFQTLIQAGIIRMTPIEDMFYLSEEQLAITPGVICPANRL